LLNDFEGFGFELSGDGQVEGVDGEIVRKFKIDKRDHKISIFIKTFSGRPYYHDGS
jgi:hypothetical protein